MARTTFRFRLKRLLDVRELREKQALQELSVRRSLLATEQQKLVELEQIERALREEQRMPYQRGTDLHEFAIRRTLLEGEIKANADEQVQQQGRITAAENAVIEQQEVVKQRGIEVKALEKLQDKQREEHRIEELRTEGLFLDDLAGQGFLRRRAHRERIEQEDAS